MAHLPARQQGPRKKLAQLARAIALQPKHDSTPQAPANPWLAAIAKLGNTAPEATEHHLWPCNLPAWQAWQGVLTQWRVGASGATGLDYVAVRAYLDAVGVPAADQPDIFKGIQACEEATLKAWQELRDKK